ncbi:MULTISPECIES: chemotaxis protein CheW [unclassified Methanoregula]|uniref:chemotaxis protein CheW n=1 Tax=unclassified Methanoregula TaxID=2649730 RepID=UPI0009D04262|nr:MULTISPECIES: chemotaxis protein CheW [unclassified Methanoregula]OPX62972.1 MAG: CheW-like domain protein [Methanoregula sp. PtaB.Bin085]OPY35185.1 MAG: CheW-like domain protein [Methanoregula sp. PtaU1.Bin006]
MINHLLFSVDDVQCALPIRTVRIVLQMVQLGPAPSGNGQPVPAGTVNLHGLIVPVFSVRSFFGIPDRAARLTDQLIVAETGASCTALWVDETHVLDQRPVPPVPDKKAEIQEPLAPGAGITADGTVIFTDLARFLEPGSFRILQLQQAGSNQRRKKTP